MKKALLAAMMTAAAALGAAAETMPQAIVGSDPLTREILTKTEQANGGVTAAVRVGSGQVIALQLADISSAPIAAALAPAAASPNAALKTAAGLKPRIAKAKARKPARRAVEQLHRLHAKKADWSAPR